MSLSSFKDLVEIGDKVIEDNLNTFVPYFYLDGHRSSSIGGNDFEKYYSGYKFFLRIAGIMKELGFKEMVTMVHTSRNCYLKERIQSIHHAIQKNFYPVDENIKDSKFNFYGDIDAYKEMGYNSFYNFIIDVKNKSKNNSEFNHHILLNYSEEWALDNRSEINLLPEVSSVIRFTKGFVSGGWIPVKMQKTTFIYSQIPSITEFWTDEALITLILISLKNWSDMKNFIGKKVYNNGERETIHSERDVNLNFASKKLNLNGSMHNRIITFGVNGPLIYEY